MMVWVWVWVYQFALDWWFRIGGLEEMGLGLVRWSASLVFVALLPSDPCN